MSAPSLSPFELATYQPNMFDIEPAVYVQATASKAENSRYKALPPGPPRAPNLLSVESGFAGLGAWVLTQIQSFKAAIFPRAAVVKTIAQASEDSLRALEGAFGSKSPKVIYEQLAQFCECRRRIADLYASVQSANNWSSEGYFETLKRMIGKEELQQLTACRKGLGISLGKARGLSAEKQLKLTYMCTEIDNLIAFGGSK
jgi:hypothetical protein